MTSSLRSVDPTYNRTRTTCPSSSDADAWSRRSAGAVKVAPAEVVKAAIAEKLLLAAAGQNVVRLLPPLNAEDDEIAEAAQRLTRALDRVAAAAT